MLWQLRAFCFNCFNLANAVAKCLANTESMHCLQDGLGARLLNVRAQIVSCSLDIWWPKLVNTTLGKDLELLLQHSTETIGCCRHRSNDWTLLLTCLRQSQACLQIAMNLLPKRQALELSTGWLRNHVIEGRPNVTKQVGHWLWNLLFRIQGQQSCTIVLWSMVCHYTIHIKRIQTYDMNIQTWSHSMCWNGHGTVKKL